jgi:hypothetical protein
MIQIGKTALGSHHFVQGLKDHNKHHPSSEYKVLARYKEMDAQSRHEDTFAATAMGSP